MCLIVFAWTPDTRYSLILGANRDEFRARPSAQADWWPDRPDILAGRDLTAHGTWLAVRRDGRFAALTNIRHPANQPAARRSRGELVLSALGAEAITDKTVYAGYNLLYGAPHAALWIDGNRFAQRPRAISAGIHGLSNGDLDDPWPKTVEAKDGLAGLLMDSLEPSDMTEALFALLASRRVYPDADLPDTGVGLLRERALSPPFIDLEDYGTRCSTVLLIEHSGTVLLTERTFDTVAPSTVRHSFKLKA